MNHKNINKKESDSSMSLDEDINQVDAEGNTKLMNLCRISKYNSEYKNIKDLMNRNCNLNAQDKKGRTALMLLVRYHERGNDSSIERYLISEFDTILLFLENENCDLSIKENYNGFSILMIFIIIFGRIIKSIEFFDLFFKRKDFDLNLTDDEGRTILFHIAMSLLSTETSCDLISYLIKDGRLKINHQSSNGSTGLMEFCSRRKFKELKLLLGVNKCNLNLKDKNGYDILNHTLAMSVSGTIVSGKVVPKPGYEELSMILIKDERCDLNSKDHTGTSIFMSACKMIVNKSIIKAMLDSGRLLIEEEFVYPNYDHVIIDHFSKKRNKTGVLLISIKKISNHRQNPLNILPNELIHLILSYSYPLVPQTKYCLN